MDRDGKREKEGKRRIAHVLLIFPSFSARARVFLSPALIQMSRAACSLNSTDIFFIYSFMKKKIIWCF